MKCSIFSEILYVGFCSEKGRNYKNYWKPWYKKQLSNQIKIWEKIIFRIEDCNFSKEDFKIIEELREKCKKNKLINYEIYLSNNIIDKLKHNSYYYLSNEQKFIINLIKSLIIDLNNALNKRFVKQDVYYILRALHNLPRALFIQNELINQAYRSLDCNDAFKFAYDNMSKELKMKYNVDM